MRMMRRALAALLSVAVYLPATAFAETRPNVPVLTAAIPAGGGEIRTLKRAHDPERTVDGRFDDWTGRLPGFGGALYRSRGELVYEDHIWDAFGADDGQDAQRFAIEDPLQAAVPETYRVDPALEYAPEEFGVPLGPFHFQTQYGNLGHQDQADLSQVRLGTDDDGSLWLLARTTTMDDTKPATGLLVLLDTAAGQAQHEVGFGTGLTTTKAETAVFVAGSSGFVRDLTTGATTELPHGSVATNAAGYDNAIEARIPAPALAGASTPGVAVAAGIANAGGTALTNVANVAFRTGEPARDYWDKKQALTLQQNTIDPFFTAVDLRPLARGANESYRPTPGYHDRIFESSPAISREGGQNGVLQHYGLYIPTTYDGTPTPVQWWFHFRGGRAHIAAAVVPGVIKQMGEDAGSIVVTPHGRGSSTWYVGKGQLDYAEVWADVHDLLSIDRNREYIAGHSMGGWASWLLPILYPDRFAAAFPASGPLTQGLWVGCDDPDMCLQEPQNGGRVVDEWLTPLTENLRWVPYVNYQGAADELVWVSGVTAQMKKMQDLGFRYRYYVFPHEEHYGPPVFDQWAEGVKYEHRFVRDPNPPALTFIRSMPLEHAVEEVNADKVPLNFDFNRAYWMSGLEPVDTAKGVARIDVRSFGIPEKPHQAVPDLDSPVSADQTDPSVMEGQQWLALPAPLGGEAPPARNAFEARLTGANAVTLCLKRMKLSTTKTISGEVTTQAPLTLSLRARWKKMPTVLVDGQAASASREGRNLLVISLPAGHHTLTIG
jgi:pimeloyl-ACP methyl ester carboxylesterase